MPSSQPSPDDPAPATNPAEEPADLSTVERAENVKHLEMIQLIVTRLASNSFFVKGWALTVAAAAFGFSVNRVDSRIAIAGTIVTVGFWFLDSFYLRHERLFRHLYNHVRRDINQDMQKRFSMDWESFTTCPDVQPGKVFFSRTLLIFYPLLIGAGVIITVLSATTTPVTNQAPTTPAETTNTQPSAISTVVTSATTSALTTATPTTRSAP